MFEQYYATTASKEVSDGRNHADSQEERGDA